MESQANDRIPVAMTTAERGKVINGLLSNLKTEKMQSDIEFATKNKVRQKSR